MSANENPAKKPAHEVILAMLTATIEVLQAEDPDKSFARVTALTDLLRKMVFPEERRIEIVLRLEHLYECCARTPGFLQLSTVLFSARSDLRFETTAQREARRPVRELILEALTDHVGMQVRETLRQIQEETAVA